MLIHKIVQGVRVSMSYLYTCVFLVCVLQVHREAVHYNIKPLVKQLEETPQFFGEVVGRQQFLFRVPHYKENIEVGFKSVLFCWS